MVDISSVQFSRSVMSNSLWSHKLQHARPRCPSPTPGVYPNSCPLSWWCNPTISSSVVPFSSCPQSFPASGSFQMSQLFPSGGQSIGVLASTSVLPMNTQDWSSLGWTGWISLQSKRLSRVFSNTTVQKHQFFSTHPSLKVISPEYSLEGLMLKLKLHYFGHLCEEITHWKRPWCWERLKAGGEGDDRGWDSWMASLTQWTWVWVNSRSWWWTRRPGIYSPQGH